jgi:hypothetical protein
VLANLGQAFASGFDSPTIRAEITKREKEIANLATQVAGQKKGSVRNQVQGLRRFVKEGLADIRGLLAGKHSNTFRVRQELARHIDAITLLPEGDAVRYKGQWKLLGEGGCAEGQS